MVAVVVVVVVVVAVGGVILVFCFSKLQALFTILSKTSAISTFSNVPMAENGRAFIGKPK